MEYYKLEKDEGFLVSQKALIVKSGRLLMLRQPSSEREWSGQWGLPGGLLEMDETMEEGLSREVREEVGLKVLSKRLYAVSDYKYDGFIFEDGRDMKMRFLGIYYVCRASGEIVLGDEHVEFKWATKEDLKSMNIGRDSKFAIEKYLREKSVE